MKGLTPSQLALLNQLFAQAGDNTVPGGWLVDGSVTVSKLDLAALIVALALGSAAVQDVSAFASAAQGALAATALQPGDAATATQGAKADTAYAWGNHALAGYQTATLKLAQDTSAGIGADTTVLPDTPVAGSSVIVLVGTVFCHKVAGAPAVGQFSISGSTISINDGSVSLPVSVYYMA